MSRDPLPPLFHAFETGAIDWPSDGMRALYLGATAGLLPPPDFSGLIAAVQGFRPDYLALNRRGVAVTPAPEGERYDLALVVAGKYRGENEAHIAEAIHRVKSGGLIVVAGGKNDGISSLRKRLTDEVGVEEHLSKNHGEVFWLRRSQRGDIWAAAVTTQQAAMPLVDGRFRTAPGMFSHDRVDAGSRLLAESLPPKLNGKAADFCAGWGYLSVSLLQRAPGIASIELFEADHASLNAAQVNLTALAADVPAASHWTDLASEPVERRFDVVVMNPPFHQGRAADPGIGHAMIRAASNALKPGGQLFMVANRGLPYEPALKKGFARVEEIADAQGFKVWKARR